MIRDAVADDYDLYARLYPELAVPDPTPSRARFEGDLVAGAYVLLDDAQPDAAVAFAYVQVLDGVGYVRQVIVDPAWRGRGCGRELMLEAARRFRARGCTRWCLNVKPDNVPAVRLYESLGMRLAHRSAAVRLGFDIGLPDGGGARDPREEELGAIEAALGLPAGLLADARKKPRIVLKVVERDGAITGVASFDPTFPGCFPFRARTAADGGALLAALAPHALAPRLQLVLEDAGELVRELSERGAEVVMEFAHYQGALA
jgi:ribosomal protein S18 acetylase RimI-like enzyme